MKRAINLDGVEAPPEPPPIDPYDDPKNWSEWRDVAATDKMLVVFMRRDGAIAGRVKVPYKGWHTPWPTKHVDHKSGITYVKDKMEHRANLALSRMVYREFGR